jgi:hypothetical protein
LFSKEISRLDLLLFCVDFLFASNYRWQESLERFRHIFDQSQGAIKDRGQKEIPMHTLPGNHDLGYEAVQTQIPEVKDFLLSPIMEGACVLPFEMMQNQVKMLTG